MSTKGARGWAKVRGAVLGKSRPFFVYPWKKSLQIDAVVLLWMTLLPLLIGLPLCLIPFESDVELSVSHHRLYAYVGMCMLGLVSGIHHHSCSDDVYSCVQVSFSTRGWDSTSIST